MDECHRLDMIHTYIPQVSPVSAQLHFWNWSWPIDLPLTYLWFTWWFPSEPKSNQAVRLIWSKSSRFPAVVAVEWTKRVWSDYFWLNRRVFSAGLRGGGNVHEKTADRSLWHRMHCLSSLCHLICHSVALILTLHMSSYPHFASIILKIFCLFAQGLNFCP